MFFQQGLIWLFLLSGGATVSNAATNSNTVRFPLLSHEGLQERRLLEQLQSRNRSLSTNPRTSTNQQQNQHSKLESLQSSYQAHRPKVITSTSNEEQRINRHDPSSRRKLSNDEFEVGGLYQGYGTHYVDLWVGTPSQRQSVIVDTGSGVTAFPCSGCNNSGDGYHASPFFEEDTSSTFEKFDCHSCQSRGVCYNRDKTR